MKKIFLSFLFFALLSCGSQERWKYDHIDAEKKYQSSKISCHGFYFDLEFLQIQEKIYGYLQTSSSIEQKEDTVSFSLFIDNVEYKKTAKGEHLLSLDEETSSQMIQALVQGKEIKVILNGYEEVFEPSNFAQNYAKFLHPPFLEKVLESLF